MEAGGGLRLAGISMVAWLHGNTVYEGCSRTWLCWGCAVYAVCVDTVGIAFDDLSAVQCSEALEMGFVRL